MLMIAQYIPWIAFAGAGFLVGWVVLDLALARLRRVKISIEAPEDSGRGLVGKPVPLSQRLEARPEPDMPVNLVRDIVVDEEPAQEWQPDPEAESRASDSNPHEAVHDTERCEAVELAPVSERALADDSERTAAASSTVVYNDAVVQRDPSVRVYDLAVAPSERRPG